MEYGSAKCQKINKRGIGGRHLLGIKQYIMKMTQQLKGTRTTPHCFGWENTLKL